MRFEHKAGDKLFVDFFGDRPSYVDCDSGKVIVPELFVAVMATRSIWNGRRNECSAGERVSAPGPA